MEMLDPEWMDLNEWERPDEIVNVVFHDGSMREMTREYLDRLPFDTHDCTCVGDTVKTFVLGLKYPPE